MQALKECIRFVPFLGFRLTIVRFNVAFLIRFFLHGFSSYYLRYFFQSHLFGAIKKLVLNGRSAITHTSVHVVYNCSSCSAGVLPQADSTVFVWRRLAIWPFGDYIRRHRVPACRIQSIKYMHVCRCIHIYDICMHLVYLSAIVIVPSLKLEKVLVRIVTTPAAAALCCPEALLCISYLRLWSEIMHTD